VLEGFRQQIGLLYARFHFRNSSDRILSFTETFSRARRALVLFPEAPADGEASTAIVKFLAGHYGNDSVVVVVRKDLRPALASVPFVKVLAFDPKNDVNAWFIPRKGFVRRAIASPFDVAFDLNVRLSLTSAFLCRGSNAPVRMSFVKEQGDRFYNVQVQTRETIPGPAPYRGFLRCLEMFERT
jgi:ADP-heptose:LPS heptosyltransferase